MNKEKMTNNQKRIRKKSFLEISFESW